MIPSSFQRARGSLTTGIYGGSGAGAVDRNGRREGAQPPQLRTSVTPFRDTVSSRPFDRIEPLPSRPERRALLSSPTKRSGDRPCHPRRSEAEIALVIPDEAKRRSGTADVIPHVPPGQPAWAEPGDGRRPHRSSDSRRCPRCKPCLLSSGSLAPGSAQAGCPGGQRKRGLQPSRLSASLRPG